MTLAEFQSADKCDDGVVWVCVRRRVGSGGVGQRLEAGEADEGVEVEAGPADECAVYVGTRHQRINVVRFDAAPVEDAGAPGLFFREVRA